MQMVTQRFFDSASGVYGWSPVSSVTVCISMSEGYNIFSNIRLSLCAVSGISAFIVKSLPPQLNVWKHSQ